MSQGIVRSMIRFDGVVVRYSGAWANALNGVSFDVPSGAMTAVAGPNGSGKSTLVRALLRRQPLVAGQITIGGESHSVLTQRELARRVAVAPQREDTAFPMRVDEYVSLGRYPRLGLWESPSREDNDAVMRALDRAGVSDFASRRTDELSGANGSASASLARWPRKARRLSSTSPRRSSTCLMRCPCSSSSIRSRVTVWLFWS